MSKIADYDTLNYDYSTYWKKREYENEAEHILLRRLFKKNKGEYFIDIGGSFGRLTDTYYDRYSKPIIIDYSLKTLQANRDFLLERYPNLELIAANAYNLPFKDGTFDGGLMVRVLHHIDTPERYFNEISRVMNNNGIYIQEIANKIHIKARLRSILKLDFSIFNQDPYQQPDRDNNEGARENADVPFLNFHPKWIKRELNQAQLEVISKNGCSYLRIPFLKKILGSSALIKLEIIMQNILSKTDIPPSIFFTTRKLSHVKGNTNTKPDVILCCPNCHNSLDIKENSATCKNCNREFSKKDNIWDFRI